MIYIFGDSFVESISPPDYTWLWPNLVASSLGQTAINLGFGGSGLEYTFQMFEQYRSSITKDDYVIIALTSEVRGYWYKNRPSFESIDSIGRSIDKNDVSNDEYNFMKYYKAFFSDIHIEKMQLHLLNFLHNVNDLAKIMEKKILIINACNETKIEPNRYPHLVISIGRLMDVSFDEAVDEDILNQISSLPDPRPNHLCATNHAILSNKIIASLTTFTDLDLTNNFAKKVITNLDLERYR